MLKINNDELERIIKKSLEDFYSRRIAKLSGLKLKDTLKKKNPYLFRSIGIEKASEIVERLLGDYMSSSDETIFGNVFFEPVARACSRGAVSGSEGIDIVIETDSAYKAISIKSGPNIFNASQSKRMNDEFATLQKRLYKMNKKFDPVLGHCYGRRVSGPTTKRSYRITSGQAFWEELTGEKDFYLKLISLMRDYPRQHRVEFEKQWAKAVNRFELEFLTEFSTSDGGIDWNKFLEFNSAIREKNRK